MQDSVPEAKLYTLTIACTSNSLHYNACNVRNSSMCLSYYVIYLTTLLELWKLCGDEERVEINPELIGMEEKWSWPLHNTRHTCIPTVTEDYHLKIPEKADDLKR